MNIPRQCLYSLLSVLIFILAWYSPTYGFAKVLNKEEYEISLIAPDAVKAIYSSNSEADTLWVDIPGFPSIIGHMIKIRIDGINAPQNSGKCFEEKALARRATKRLREILKNSHLIVLAKMNRGRSFEIVARVIVDGVDIGEALVEEKLARHDTLGHIRLGIVKTSWCHGEFGRRGVWPPLETRLVDRYRLIDRYNHPPHSSGEGAYSLP